MLNFNGQYWISKWIQQEFQLNSKWSEIIIIIRKNISYEYSLRKLFCTIDTTKMDKLIICLTIMTLIYQIKGN